MLKIGLSLSGGGAKGVAHLGMIKCLEDNDIYVDIMSGTSSGSMVAILYSMGLNTDEILNILMSCDFKSFKTITKLWSQYGLIDTNELFKLLEKKLKKYNLSNMKFKDLNIPTYISATNIQQGTEKVFSNEETPEQYVLEAMLASSSYPLAFSPTEIDSILYSDGGILNHFPVNLIYGKCNYLIGSYVTPNETFNSEKDKEHLKHPKNTVFRAFSLQGVNAEYNKFHFCNYVFSPSILSHYSTFDVSNATLKKIFNIGYSEMSSQHETIKILKKIMRYKKILIK